MKQQFPRLLVLIFGSFLLFQFFVPHESSEWVYEYLLDWIIIIGIFALAIGIWSLIRVHVDKIKNKRIGWQYSYVTLAGLVGFIVFGFTARNGNEWGLFFPFVFAVIGIVLMIVQAMATRAKAALFTGLAGVFALIALVIGIFDNAFSFYFATSEGLQAYMFRHSFDFVLIPIFATMFSLLAFFIASAA